MSDYTTKEAQEFQETLRVVQDEIARIVVTGESGGGMVKVSMNGRYNVRKITIDPTLLDNDKDMLEDLIAAAVNNAVSKVNITGQSKLSRFASGIPSLFSPTLSV